MTDATTERRRLESAALTARKALTDERREWSADKDTLLAAVREACHRADLASGEAEEAKVSSFLVANNSQFAASKPGRELEGGAGRGEVSPGMNTSAAPIS